jgi:hypothetical protein
LMFGAMIGAAALAGDQGHRLRAPPDGGHQARTGSEYEATIAARPPSGGGQPLFVSKERRGRLPERRCLPPKQAGGKRRGTAYSVLRNEVDGLSFLHQVLRGETAVDPEGR